MDVRLAPDCLSHLKVAILIKCSQDLFNSLWTMFKRYFKVALTVHPEQLQAALECHWEGFPLSPDLILYVKAFLRK